MEKRNKLLKILFTILLILGFISLAIQSYFFLNEIIVLNDTEDLSNLALIFILPVILLASILPIVNGTATIVSSVILIKNETFDKHFAKLTLIFGIVLLTLSVAVEVLVFLLPSLLI